MHLQTGDNRIFVSLYCTKYNIVLPDITTSVRIATQASIKVLRQLTCVITHFNIQQKKKKIFTITTPAYLWITVSHTGQIQKTGSLKSALWWPHKWTNDSFPAQSDNKRDILKIWTALQQFTLTELIKFYLKWFYMTEI